MATLTTIMIHTIVSIHSIPYCITDTYEYMEDFLKIDGFSGTLSPTGVT